MFLSKVFEEIDYRNIKAGFFGRSILASNFALALSLAVLCVDVGLKIYKILVKIFITIG